LVNLLISQAWDAGTKEPVRRPRVAIVGAGPAGVGCAVELVGQGRRGLGKGVEVEVVVFEEKGRIGGRMVLGDEGEVEVEDVMSGGLMESLIEVIRDSGSEEWKGMKVSKQDEDVGM
jgi:prenylcysteine oxidase/farnesylcysteine lyase